MADTDKRPILKPTAQSVIWADTNIHDIGLIVKPTAQSVIWANTDKRPILKPKEQSVIWADTDIHDSETHSTECE